MTKLAVQRTMTPTVERRSWVASTTSYEELLSCPPPTHTQNIAMEGYNQEQSVCGGTFIIETRDHGLQRAPTWTRPRHSVKKTDGKTGSRVLVGPHKGVVLKN